MAVRHRLIKVSPQTVWAVLADGSRYAEWVVGTSSSEPVRGQWPEVGSAIGYEVRLGPVRLTNETVVRYCREGSELGLEARAGALGTARISLELHPWGRYCLVIADEHPLQGAGGKLHNVGVEALIQLRHRAMLARLTEVCEAQARAEQLESGREQRRAAAQGAGGGHA
ncbi:SRPBCC family protein [Streptomyces resistomycificus]|uniref:Polyketide cyclase n=1 Tax=Streptomyces resistomycificus TaxID=67356 RepID=A0A0L8LWL3_9ACTN|nr:SRPBCC family protein [Streptomyces resistomycificus]KOG42469.1 polyketide cyclase [Streptomyces resistomycificus]KUN92620.1 polyketide cyclase [Streptomyces resistomycificus]